MKITLKIIAVIIALSIILCCFSSCGLMLLSSLSDNNDEPNYELDLKEYYHAVIMSKQKMDSYLDDIYKNWYDAIFNDEFGGSSEVAVSTAVLAHENDIKDVKSADSTIKRLYNRIKGGKDNNEISAVHAAYVCYYDFFTEPDGNLYTYYSTKEEYKSALESALNVLSRKL